MIQKDTIDKIFETAKIEEVVGDFVNLKKKGVNYIGNCPFHNEKTPSFTVSPTKGIYKCFGCGKGGNSVRFIMDMEHYTYPEALKYIAKKYQIEVIEKELSSEQKAVQSKRESLYVVSSFANKFFQDSLWNTKEGKNIGVSYFKERGFNEETIKEFMLGYSPKKSRAFSNTAIKNTFDKDFLVESGLSILNKSTNNLVDRFNERVIFPIHSFSGRVLGFGGRSFNAKAKAKYINSPESLIYHKGKVLYGLYQSKASIAKEKNCLIVEGYTDVISMHQNKIKNVVSASGTALGISQLSLISRLTENITLMFDGDEAGIKATYRTIDLALQNAMNVKVFVFPENEDPDSYSKKLSPEEFKIKIESSSLNFVDYKILTSKLNYKKDPKEIIKIKRNIFKSISAIPDSLIRSQYCKTYCQKLDVSEEVMLKEVSQARVRGAIHDSTVTKRNNAKIDAGQRQKRKTKNSDKLTYLELEILRLLLNYGNDEFLIDNEKITVHDMIITDLSADKISFSNSLFQDLYVEIIQQIEKNKKINLDYFTNNINEKINTLSIDLISNKHSISSNWAEQHNILTVRENEKMRQTTEKAILALKKCHVDIRISDIQEKINSGEFEREEVEELNSLTKIKTNIARIMGRNIG